MQLPETLAGWLALLEARHGQTVRLGLARVAGVAARIALEPQCPVITVGGTNGKGSTCAMLEAILQAAGYRVGLYSSPHLLRYNERVRIDGREADDEALVRAMEQVEIARGDTPLTYFEHGTLAALAVFREAAPDVVILEVGLGGRLDAVNVIDSDCAIVTSVALDHMDFLGQDREAIGFEKAGIFRAGKPAICADPEPPASLVAHVDLPELLGAALVEGHGLDGGGIALDGTCLGLRLFLHGRSPIIVGNLVLVSHSVLLEAPPSSRPATGNARPLSHICHAARRSAPRAPGPRPLRPEAAPAPAAE